MWQSGILSWYFQPCLLLLSIARNVPQSTWALARGGQSHGAALPFAVPAASTPLLQEGSPNLQLIYSHIFCLFILSERQGQDTVDHQVWDSMIGSVQNGEFGDRTKICGYPGTEEGKGVMEV